MNFSRVEEIKLAMVSAVKLAKGEPEDFNSQSVTQGLVRSKGWFFANKSLISCLLSSPTVSLLLCRDWNSASLDLRLCLQGLEQTPIIRVCQDTVQVLRRRRVLMITPQQQ